MDLTSEKPVTKIARRSSTTGRLFTPYDAISRRSYLGAAVFTVAFIFAIWAILSYGKIVRPSYFLPTPSLVLTTAGQMIQSGELVQDTATSLYVIFTGWALAVLVSVPVGILIGTYKIVEAFLEPPIDFMRYLPVSALIPLLIVWVGIDVKEKITVIFLGTFFQLVLMVADVAGHVSRDLLDSAYTLGVSRTRVLTTVLIPATLPGVMDALRITLGWAWTYLIVAELVAADFGLGVMIQESERGFRTDKIFVGLVTIGVLGFISDFIFKWLHPRLLPWSPRLH